jgi:DNA-binding PadR family transcriptional regulator
MQTTMLIAPEALLPLPSHDFQVLLSLADQPSHAYGLARAVEEAGAGNVRLELGSLYRILARLTTAGVIEEFDPPRAGGHDAKRRYYRLTTFGRKVAEAEAARLQAVLGLARRRRLLPAKGPR